jgi:hypothetical protein
VRLSRVNDPWTGFIDGIIFFVLYAGIGLGCYFLFGGKVAGIVIVASFFPLLVLFAFFRAWRD